MKRILINSAIIACLVFSYINTQAQSKSVKSSDRFVILIDEFEQNNIQNKGDYLSKKLSFQIPYLISSSLEKSDIQIKWYGEIASEQRSSVKNQYSTSFNNIKVDPQTLAYYDIDYRIKGEYALFNGTYDVRVNIITYNENKQPVRDTTISHLIENRDNIELAMVLLSNKIKDYIKKPDQQRKIKKIGIFEFDQQFKKGQPNDKYIGKDLSFSIYYDLTESVSKQTSYELKNFIQDSIKYTVNRNLLKERNLDAAIGGNITYVDDSLNVTVEPYVLIKKPEVKIVLPTLYGNAEYYYLMSEGLYSATNEILTELIDENSKWNDKFLNTLKLTNYNSLIDNAETYVFLEKYALAEVLLQKAYEIDSDWKYYYLNGLLKAYTGDLNNALSMYNKALKLNNQAVEVYYQKGFLYDYFENYDSSIVNYQKIEQLDPNYPLLYNYLGLSYSLLEDYENSINAYTEQLSKDTVDSETYMGLAISYYMLALDSTQTESEYNELMTKSVQTLDKMMSLYGDDEYVTGNCYDIFVSMGIDQYYIYNMDLALNLFKKAHQIYPSLDTYELLRLVYNELADFEKADSLIDQGLEFDVYTDSIYYTQGEDLRYTNYINKNNMYYEKALEYFDKYLEMQPENSIAMRKKGSTYFRMHQYNSAIEYYRKAQKLENNLVEKSMILLDIAEVQVLNNSAADGLIALKEINNYLDKLPEKNRKEITVLQQYLNIVINKIIGNNTEADEVRLQNQLKDIYIERWSFKTFKNWLDSDENNLSDDLVNELRSLTELAESRLYTN